MLTLWLPRKAPVSTGEPATTICSASVAILLRVSFTSSSITCANADGFKPFQDIKPSLSAKSMKGLKPSAFAHLIEDEVKETRNKIATEALQMVVAGSPVDTG